MTYSTLFHQIIFKPLQQGIMRFIPSAKEEMKLKEFLKVSKRLFGIASFIVVGISSIIITFFFINKNQIITEVLIITVLFTVFSAYKTNLDSLLNTLFYRKLSVIFQASEIWFRYFLTSLLLLLITNNVFFAILGYFLSVMISYIIENIKFNRLIINEIIREDGISSTDWHRLILNYGIPFSMWGIFSWLEFASPRWILQFNSSTHEVGLFAASFQLGFYPTALISGVIIQYITPIAFTKAGLGKDKMKLERAYRIIKIIANLSIIISLIAFITSLSFKTLIVTYLLGRGFEEVANYFPYFVLSSGLFMVGQVLELIFQTANKTKELLYIKVLTSLLLVVTTFLFTYGFGLRGLIYSLLTTYLFYSLIIYKKSRVLIK
jgi:O-antigen/teichoic acid export membrane protein